LPFVTGVFPLGCQAGGRATVQVAGWNLPETMITFDAKDKAPGVYPLSVRNGQWVSNSVPFAVDAMPDYMETRPADSRDAAQTVALPIIVNGRIDQPGQWDVYRFEGRAGDEIVAEVTARRLDSPMDSVLKLADSAGRQLACNDDHEDKATGLNTHHADSCIRAKLPASGTYYVHVGDVQRQSGADCAYRLRLSAPVPDFALRIAPSSINVRSGASVPVTVYALRKDGFAGPIELSLKDAPAGFTLTGGTVPADADQVRLTLTGPPRPLDNPVSLSLEGRATIDGKPAVRQAVPAEDMMQAFAYRHLVVAKNLEATVSGGGGRAGGRVPPRVLSPTPVKIASGKTAGVRVSLPASTPFGEMIFELSEPPDGMTIKGVSPAAGGSEILLQADAAKVKPGLKGNLIVNIFMLPKPPPSTAPATSPATGAGTAPATRPANPQANQRRLPMGTFPAIPFEVVSP
jgi:hypothetical protein